MAFWSCPTCGRRVPGYAPKCHCGTVRTATTELESSSQPRRAAPAGRRPGRLGVGREGLGWQAWAWALLAVLAMALGVWQLTRPVPRLPALFLLGIVDPPRPSPSPLPSPSARRASPRPRAAAQ